MKIVKQKNKPNYFNIENLTLARVLDIMNALEYCHRKSLITRSGSELLKALNLQTSKLRKGIIPREIDEIETGCYYKSLKTKYTFRVVCQHREGKWCGIVNENNQHSTVSLDKINNDLIKGKIVKFSY